jgi:hypothetical protein
MKQKDFDIYEILKGVPAGTKLYTPICGKVAFTCLASSKEIIRTEDKNGGVHCFDKNGKWMEEGEVMLFPSNEMRDWSKFAWKKGDVLAGSFGVLCIFEKWANADYTKFDSKFVTQKNRGTTFEIEDWYKVTNKAVIKQYISDIEEDNGGKLNLTTLKIEKPKKKLVFELGKLYVFNEEDEDGELTIIGKLIGKNESEDTLTFGNQYEIENEKFVTDQAFDLNISVHEELREATEDEAVKFQEACTLWEKRKKQGKEQSPFNPLDKVLVRCGKGRKWLPAFFVRVREEYSDWRCTAFLIHSGKTADFTNCIPFEGNESIAWTDIDDLPF